jgi:hypothetical protein
VIDFMLSLTIFWRLVLAHLLADFTLQTNRVAAWKRESLWGTIMHSAIFGVCALALCWPYTTALWHLYFGHIVLRGWAIILILMMLHFAEDQWRVSAIVKHTKEDSLAFFVWDQGFHIGTIFLLSPAVVAPVEKWVMLAILAIFVTHFSAILIYYLERFKAGEAQLQTQDKYKLMAERFCIALAMVIPGWWAAGLAALWVLRSKSIAGNILALSAGLLTRYIIH